MALRYGTSFLILTLTSIVNSQLVELTQYDSNGASCTLTQDGTKNGVTCIDITTSDFIGDFLRNINESVSDLSVTCSFTGGTFTLNILQNVNHSLESFAIDNCYITLSESVELPDALKYSKNLRLTNLGIQSKDEPLIDMQQYVNMSSFDFIDNQLLVDAKTVGEFGEYQPIGFSFEQSTICESSYRNCYCKFEKEEEMHFASIYCFEADARQVIDLITYLNRSSNVSTGPDFIIKSINLFNQQFTDTHSMNDPYYSTTLKSMRNFLRINTRPYPQTFGVYFSGNLSPNVSSADARQQIRRIYSIFIDLDQYLDKLAVVSCANIGPLAAADGEVNETDYRIDTSSPMIPIAFGQVKKVDFSQNGLNMSIMQQQYKFPIGNTFIQEICFRKNLFTWLTVVFGFLLNPQSLTKLDLSRNTMSRIDDDALIAFQALEWLDLSDNRLKSIRPQWFSGLSKLKFLDLANNAILGVSYQHRNYPTLWPASLEYLNLTNNGLVDQDDPKYTNLQEPGTLFDHQFFMGLSNLTYLDLSATTGCITSSYFKPLRSLQTLILSDSERFDGYTYTPIKKGYYCMFTEDMFAYLPSLKVLNLARAGQLANSSFYEKTCEMFDNSPLVQSIDISDSKSPPCENISALLEWLDLKTTKENFTLEFSDATYCIHGDKSVEMALLMKNAANQFPSKDYGSDTQGIVKSNYTFNAQTDSATSDDLPSTWIQVRPPILIGVITTLIIFLVVFPGGWFLCGRLRRSIESSMSMSEKPPHCKCYPNRASKKQRQETQKSYLKRRSKLKKEFLSSTLINGFAYAYGARHVWEKLVWYACILFFAAVFIYNMTNLWVQWKYGPPSTTMDMVNSPSFVQLPFTLCLPLEPRNLQLSSRDVAVLSEPSQCSPRITRHNQLPIYRDLFFDTLLYRIGLQMSWEGAMLTNPLQPQDFVATLDQIVKERNKTYSKLLIELSQEMCTKMNINAYIQGRDPYVQDRDDPAAPKKLIFDPDTCRNVFSDPQYGISWYNLDESKRYCLRFPGLFNFDGYRVAGLLSFKTLQVFADQSTALIDLLGHVFGKSAGKSNLPVLLPINRETALNIQVKSVMKNLEYFRDEAEPRCYQDCVGSQRVKEILKKCKCKPLMWPQLTVGQHLPECTLQTYNASCNLSLAGELDMCANTVPCEQWDYDVSTTDFGLTSDNTTIIRFNGINTMYLVVAEEDGRTLINLLGDVGGVLGLWLGASIMACIHVVVFFIKMFILMIPDNKCGKTNHNIDEEAAIRSSSKKRPHLYTVSSGIASINDAEKPSKVAFSDGNGITKLQV